MLAEALDATGGPLSENERDWADGVLGTVERGRPTRGVMTGPTFEAGG